MVIFRNKFKNVFAALCLTLVVLAGIPYVPSASVVSTTLPAGLDASMGAHIVVLDSVPSPAVGVSRRSEGCSFTGLTDMLDLQGAYNIDLNQSSDCLGLKLGAAKVQASVEFVLVTPPRLTVAQGSTTSLNKVPVFGQSNNAVPLYGVFSQSTFVLQTTKRILGGSVSIAYATPVGGVTHDSEVVLSVVGIFNC